MKKLTYYELDFDRSFEYFKENLDSVNKLSSKIMQLVNFKEGKFITLLPLDTSVDQIYQFNCGGIAEYVRNDFPYYILKKLKSNNQFSCIIDDFNENRKNVYMNDLYKLVGFHYNEEVYYLINQMNAQLDLIDDCLETSNTIWHSLCILSKFSIKLSTEKEINLEQINSICMNTETIVVCAYDGEGYIIWERRS